MPLPTTFDVTFYDGMRKPGGRRRAVEWAELADLLVSPTPTDCDCDKFVPDAAHPDGCPLKDGFAWSPGALREGTTRKNVNVEHVSALVFDLDGLSAADVRTVLGALDGLAYVAHSTHSHRPPSKPSSLALRAVVPLSRPVPGPEWGTFWHSARAQLGLDAVRLDEACKDPSRLYFTPRVPKARMDKFLSYDVPGDALDVDAVLTAKAPPEGPGLLEALAPEGSAVTATHVPPAHSLPARTYDLQELTTILKALRTKYARAKNPNAELLGRVLDGEPIAPHGGRDNAINVVMSTFATALPAGTPSDVAFEIARRSITTVADPEGVEHWQKKAEGCYQRAAARREVNDRLRAAQDVAVANHLLSVLPRSALSPAHREAYDAARAADPSTPADPEKADEEEHWKTKLKMLVPKGDGIPQLAPDPLNLALMLTHVPDWRGALRWNVLRSEVEVIGGPLLAHERDVEVLPLALSNWMAEHLNVRFALADVKQTILLVARANQHDPVAEYLNGLRWDGVFRAHTLLSDYVQGRLDTDLGLGDEDAARLLSEIGTKWLVGCVARALDPGCQVDTTLVLEGVMGRKKSSFFSAIGGPFYTVATIDFADKDTKMVAARTWIVELAELAGLLGGRSRESTNGFLTTRVDAYRPPYGASIVDKPRRCVFVGTTEDDDWLTSDKGIRRWWPVRVADRIDIDALVRDRDQLWAEATALYRAGTQWWFEPDDELKLRHVAASRVRSSAVADKIAEWWRSIAPEKRPAAVWVSTVAVQALGKAPGDLHVGTEREVSNALTAMGFTRGARERIGGHRVRVFVPTPELMRMPSVKAGQTPSPFQVLAGGAS